MAGKKDRNLRIGVEADTSEAQKAIAALGDAAGAASEAAATGTDRMADAAERSAKAFERGAQASRSTSESMSMSARNITRIATSMAGMMAGLAAKYASHRVDPDSALGTALEYGGNALSQGGAFAATGAAVGGAAGAAVGAGVGVVKGVAEAWIDRDNRELDAQKAIAATAAENRKLIDTMLAAEERTEAFRKTLSGFGDETIQVSDRISSLEQAISTRRDRELELRNAMMVHTGENADKDSNTKFKELMHERSSVMSDIAHLENMLDHLRQIEASPSHDPRASLSGLDALERVGASFGAGPTDGARDMVLEQRKTNDTLLVISNKLNNGAGQSVWR